MAKKIKIIIALLLLPFVVFGIWQISKNRTDANANYYGGLIVNTGVPHDGPMFMEDDFKPGDCEIRNISVKNNTKYKKNLTVRSMNVEETGDMSTALDIVITQNGNILYENSLSQFFTDSKTLDGIILDSLEPGETKVYSFEVCFDIEAGNEFQKKYVKFDLSFGDVISPIELPEKCSHLTGIITSVINGTNGRDRIEGTHASELIMSFDGNDRIDGGAGHDCIVTGNGNSRIDGSSGNDVIITGNGNNNIDDGGAGDDRIYTGNGNDKIGGGSGNDLIYSGGGNDNVYGDSGNDEIYLGTGNDNANGDSGNDKIYGEDGLDVLRGDTGNDYLNGGADSDKLFGGTGTDDCDEGEVLNSCEL